MGSHSHKVELSKKAEVYRRKVQAEIQYCVNCQPFDEGEAVWIYGERTDVEGVLDELNVPEKFRNQIVENLCCPNCGNEYFDTSSEVGVKTKFDTEVERHMDKVYRLYGSEVTRFEELLENFPFLAYSDKFARKIHNELKKRTLPTVSVLGQFYRARKVEGAEVLAKEGLYNPPVGKPEEGRFNHAGQSYLYLSNDKATAIKEVVSGEKPLLVWCQKFEIVEKVENVLDLSFDWSMLSPSTSTVLLSLKIYNSLGRADRNKGLWKPDYYLTRFIMDCAKEQGYQGIKYNSAKDIEEFDVVLFYSSDLKIEALGNPSVEIFMNKADKHEFQANIG